jgi:hypothetical protein
MKNLTNMSLRGTKQSQAVKVRSVLFAIASYLAMTRGELFYHL